ncbi:MAG: hypothetical protein H6Q10_3335 [Acidobacteria bacterium]|nr:hypothetical protein [Acidobacteriota bacterium]
MHVESGAVLASRVRLDRLATRQHLGWLRGNSEPGDEAALIVAPARWAHTFFATAPTDVAFVDADGRVVKIRRSMRPWRVALALEARGVIQAMPGFITRSRTRVGDRVALREEQAARPVRDAAAWHSEFDQASESARAEFRDSVSAALADEEAGADPWGVGPADAPDLRPQVPREEAPAPAPSRPAPAPAPSRPAPAPPPTRPAPAPARVETGDAGRPKPASNRAFQKGVDLAALTARETPIAWFEAVAIVQELCAVLLNGRRGDPPAEFEAEDVAITAEGTVEVRGGASHGLPSVPQVGHLLLTLLGEAETLPVQLRLFALQEVSPTPRCSTLGEFSNQLALFERPNRQATIREVYQRFMAMPARPAEAPAAAKATPRPHRPRVARVPLWRSRRFRGAAAAVAVLAVAGAAAALLWQAGVPLLWGGARAGAPAAAAGDGASMSEEAVARIREAALRIWGARPPSRAPMPATVPPAQPAGLELPKGVLPDAPATLALPASAGSLSGGVAEAGPAAASSRVFSSFDPDVVAPVLVRPHLPASPRPGVREEDLPQVELVVSPSGDVESVKLVTPSAGVHSAMMLSAIKTWHFQPASLDGRAVRYRLLLRLTNQ